MTLSVWGILGIVVAAVAVAVGIYLAIKYSGSKDGSPSSGSPSSGSSSSGSPSSGSQSFGSFAVYEGRTLSKSAQLRYPGLSMSECQDKIKAEKTVYAANYLPQAKPTLCHVWVKPLASSVKPLAVPNVTLMVNKNMESNKSLLAQLTQM